MCKTQQDMVPQIFGQNILNNEIYSITDTSVSSDSCWGLLTVQTFGRLS